MIYYEFLVDVQPGRFFLEKNSEEKTNRGKNSVQLVTYGVDLQGSPLSYHVWHAALEMRPGGSPGDKVPECSSHVLEKNNFPPGGADCGMRQVIFHLMAGDAAMRTTPAARGNDSAAKSRLTLQWRAHLVISTGGANLVS